jgi:UDP-N-acetylmuramate dehydrogenase
MKELLQHNQRLSNYTTLKIGGEAEALVEVGSEAELRAALRYAGGHTATPPLILGGGSNVLISDAGYPGLVIINRIPGYDVVYETDKEVHLRVGAGEVFDAVVERTIDDGYWGLENLSAIPGSVGATPIQNVGAYGVEIASVIEVVEAMHIETGEARCFTTTECAFAYRDSFFKTATGRQWCVTHVTYRLQKLSTPVLSYQDLASLRAEEALTQHAIRQHVIAVRAKKFPDWHTVGTAGSFFKNPIISEPAFNALKQRYSELPGFQQEDGQVKVSLGWILDKVCGLRGHKEGKVRLYEAQALVLVTDEGATASEVEVFATHIAKKVFDATNINIEREVLSV